MTKSKGVDMSAVQAGAEDAWRSSLVIAAGQIGEAVESGYLLTLSDLSRVTGVSKTTIGAHLSRGRITPLRVGIDNYYFLPDVAVSYPNTAGVKAYRAGKWAAWWAENGRHPRGRSRGR